MCKCCYKSSCCNSQLFQGVLCAAVGTLIISTTIFLSSFIYIIITKHTYPFNNNPLRATFFLLGLLAICISLYDVFISSLLLHVLIKQGSKNNLFISSLWYVSHLSIIVIYVACVIVAMVIAHRRHDVCVFFVSFFFGCVIICPLIYFTVVVNRYLHSLNQGRYF